MTPMTFRSVPEVLLGAGLAQQLGELLAARCTGRRALVVTDKGLASCDMLRASLNALNNAGFETALFSDVVADPPETVVLKAIALAQSAGCELVIGFGGGSSLDVAKLAAAFARSGQPIGDAYGVGKLAGPRLPLYQIPTTAGTGSEATAVAIVTTGAQTKAGIVSPLLLCDAAVLDPELTLGLPAAITAATGIDAMVHAVEAYTSRVFKNRLSDLSAQNALQLLGRSIRQAYKVPGDLAARSDMLLGSMLAGQAFANAPVGGVHALAYPVGAMFHVPHGVSNALMLGAVLRFNLEAAAPLYAELAAILVPTAQGSDEARAQALVLYFEDLMDDLKLPRRLGEVGIHSSDVAQLAEQAILQQRLLVNNPRPIGLDDAAALYRQAC